MKMNSKEEENLPPHVLVFPYPVQGHLNPMLNLAHLFCLSGFHVTFVISDFSHRRLLRNTTVPATFAAYPGFQFLTLPDGLPDDHPRAGERVLELMPALASITIPLLKKTIIEQNFLASAGRRRPLTCYVADGLMSDAADFAVDIGIPLIYFRTASACYFLSLLRFPELLEAQEIPFHGKPMDGLVKAIEGMEGFFRRRDLPSFYRVDDVTEPLLQKVAVATQQIVRAQAAIFNTCEDLEGPILAQIRKQMPRIYSIGPLHEHLKSRLADKKEEASIVAASLWAEDQSCIVWLDAQPPRSVIYVSFGSITTLTREQLIEFWRGLLDSSQRFLWVMRPDSIGKDGKEQIPVELVEESKGKGMLVEWAPQEKVLNHPAVGGFLMHSGWNSTLESIAAGVPMICWPYFADQMTNSRFVSEVWKIGLDIKDTCDRVIVEKAVRELMEVRKDEFLVRAEQMKRLVKSGVSEGGSSYRSQDGLIEYIESLVIS